MHITIAGLNIETSETLQAHAAEKMQLLTKYFDHIVGVDISLKTERANHLAEITVSANGIFLRAIGEGKDFYGAIDDAETKLARQLEKYKGRLKKHLHRRVHHAERLSALEALMTTESAVEDESLSDAPEDMFADYAPKINHKDVKKLEPMSVDDAVMQMDLLHKPAFLFQNASTGKLNMVYREEAGHVRWVEPA